MFRIIRETFRSFFPKKQKKGYYDMATKDDEKNDNYLLDFRNGFMSPGGFTVEGTISSTGNMGSYDNGGKKEKKKIIIKPKDVFEELERVPTMWSLENIDDKIAILKDKADLVSQTYAKRELNDLISRLECRKKLNEIDTRKTTFNSYFRQFDTTTDAKIEILLKKYDLVMKPADIFIPEFPANAVEIMKAFTSKVKKITGKKPVYYVIATDESFEKAYEKRDPILLAQSPFGFYYYILGAWDYEMVYLPEL